MKWLWSKKSIYAMDSTTHTHTLSLSLSVSLSPPLSLSLSLSLTHRQTDRHRHRHTHTHTHTHGSAVDMGHVRAPCRLSVLEIKRTSWVESCIHMYPRLRLQGCQYPPPHMTHMYHPPRMTHMYHPPHMTHMYHPPRMTHMYHHTCIILLIWHTCIPPYPPLFCLRFTVTFLHISRPPLHLPPAHSSSQEMTHTNRRRIHVCHMRRRAQCLRDVGVYSCSLVLHWVTTTPFHSRELESHELPTLVLHLDTTTPWWPRRPAPS
jgi:hypothetical protein